MRILHVDDEHGMRDLTATWLKKAGYNVESAANGVEAWNRLEPDFDSYALVITDAQMPFRTGRELVKLLRDRQFPGRIIVYSGSVDLRVIADFVDMGVDAVISKEGKPDSLLSAVHKVMH